MSGIRTTQAITRSTARDIVREIEYRDARRRWRRNGALAGGVLGTVLLAMLFLKLGQRGIGTGRAGTTPPAPPTVKATIRLDATGLTVNGSIASIEAAVLVAREAGGADVVVTGDAREGDWQALLAALRASGVPFEVRG